MPAGIYNVYIQLKKSNVFDYKLSYYLFIGSRTITLEEN